MLKFSILVVLLWQNSRHFQKKAKDCRCKYTKLWQNKNLQLTTLQVAKDDISELLSPRDRLTTEDTENPAKSLPYLRSKIGWRWGKGGGQDQSDLREWQTWHNCLLFLILGNYLFQIVIGFFYNYSFFHNKILCYSTEHSGMAEVLY